MTTTTKTKKKWRSPRDAVFNGHINNAADRAVNELLRSFPKYAAEIKKLRVEGIMSIFNEDPTPATAAYVALVTLFVNEDKQ